MTLSQRQYINLFHVLVVAPLLGYLAYSGLYSRPVPRSVYWLLAVLAVGVLAYHAYRLVQA